MSEEVNATEAAPVEVVTSTEATTAEAPVEAAVEAPVEVAVEAAPEATGLVIEN